MKESLHLLGEWIGNMSELIALVIAIVHYRWLKGSFMRWTLPFLAFVFIGELFSRYQYNILKQPNVDCDYLIGIAESIFYGSIFYQLTNRKIFKRQIQVAVFINVLIYAYGLFADRTDYKYFIPGLIISGFFLAIIALGYIYTKFADDEEAFLFEEPGFWIAFGVSLFFSGISIVFCLYDVIVTNKLNFFGLRLYNLIPRLLCILLYLSISIAIIMCKKKKMRSLKKTRW